MKSDHSVKSEREAALNILLQVLEEGRFSGSAIDRELEKYPRTPESRAFITRLCEGTIERLITIDDSIDACASVKCRKMKPVIRNILRMSVYQILFMDHVADAVAVNEAVALAKKRGYAGLAKFTNGVLRTVVRKKESFSFYAGKRDLTEPAVPAEPETEIAENERAQERHRLSVFYSVPEWLVCHMERCVGEKRSEEVFKEYLTVRPLQARINRSKADRREVTESLTAEGLRVSEHPYLDSVICLENTAGLTRTRAFREGWFQIQDASSVLAVTAAGIRPGMRVLDVCAAPGGKSLCAADLRAEEVISRDLSEQKVARIRENAARCHFESVIRAEAADARIFDPALEAWADVVIADLPCSGLGVIAKKPDIKYRVQPGELAELAALQKEILGVVWRYLKPGGVLIYSTCTVSREENEENVRWFLSRGFPMEADDMTPFLPERLLVERKKRRMPEEGECQGEIRELQLLPGEYETDGFFIARFRRNRGHRDPG